MNSLKFALSTQQSPNKPKGDVDGSLLKGVNKSKNQTMWALDVDTNEEATEESLNSDALMRILNDKLQSAFQKDSKSISEITLQRIIEQFQDQAGGSKSQIAYLMVIEDKLTDILEFSKDDFKKFCGIFQDMISDKIEKLRKKQKKSELSNYDKIVSGNFKKKAENTPYLTVQNNLRVRKSREKDKLCSKSPGKKESSNENKLARLFSKDKKQAKERDFKDSLRKEENQGGFNQTHHDQKDESVSFSAVLATTTVKSRRRKDSRQYRQKKVKHKKNEANEDEKEQDEAFIFFRPKKHKK